MREVLTADGHVRPDPWVPGPLGDTEAPVLCPLGAWLDAGAPAPHACLGLELPVDAEPENLPAAILRAPLLAVRFPNFADGRGLSLGVLLRSRLRFAGELRATGPLLPDLLHYLVRCGFDSVDPEGRFDLHTHASRLGSPRLTYQGSVRDPRPLYRRRLATGESGAVA